MADPRRWLILVHQLPPRPSNLRVRVWRRLQQVGAVVLRNSLYVLPATDEAREDFNWVREEIVASKGQVSVLEASAIDGYTDGELVQQFRKLRETEYEVLTDEIRAAGRSGGRSRRSKPTDRTQLLRALRERFGVIQARDYFGASGRERVEQALADLERSQNGAGSPPAAAPRLQAKDFRGRTWLTRPRPGIDRFACAWFIRRFVDANARFAFADALSGPRDTRVPFDMPGVEFGHRGADCSFETLIRRFGVRDTAVSALSRVVHDLDFKEARFGMPEGAAVGRLVDGLRASFSDDADLLEQGIVVMEALYRSFSADRRGAGGSARRPSRTRTQQESR
jgi:hypothetical protein